MKAFNATQLEAIKNQECNGLTKRLIETAEDALNQLEVALARVAELEKPEADSQIARPEKERILVFIHADGYVEVFGERWCTAKVVYVPAYEGTQAEVAELEDAVIDSLPACYRDLCYANKSRATGHVSNCPNPKSLAAADKTTQALTAIAFLENVIHQQKARGEHASPSR